MGKRLLTITICGAFSPGNLEHQNLKAISWWLYIYSDLLFLVSANQTIRASVD